MNATLFYLLVEFNTITPTLDEVTKKYLGIEPSTANYRVGIGRGESCSKIPGINLNPRIAGFFFAGTASHIKPTHR